MMKKTVALFALAALLLLVASVIGVRHFAYQAVEPHIEPVAVTAIDPPVVVHNANDSFTIGKHVRMSASLANRYLPADRPNQAQILFDLQARLPQAGQRAPVSVVLVMDRSGSMAAQDKFEQAKRAAKSLIERLDDKDRVALVSYSTDVSLDVSLTQLRGQRGRLSRAIDDLLDGGATNLGGGLSKALDELKMNSSSGDIRRILLMSDGNANQGITEPDDLATISESARRDGITISTLGVGLDFGEDLMTLIAQSGGGGYYYARNGAAVAKAFDSELASLQAMAARGVEISLELPPGVSLAEVYGYRPEMRGPRVVIPVGDMADNEKRRVMVRLNVAPGSEGVTHLATVELAYAQINSASRELFAASMSAQSTSDQALLQSGARIDVEAAFADAASAQVRQEAAESFAQGDQQTALDKLQRQLRSLRKQNTRLKSKALNRQQQRIQTALDRVNASPASPAGKDFVKSEKLEARRVFAY